MLLVNVPASSASKMTSIVKPSSSALTSAGTEDCSNNNAMQTKSSPPDEDDFDDTKSSKRRRRRKKLKDDFELPESLPNVFEFSTSLYRFTEHLAEFTKLYQEVFPQLMADKNKYFISTEQQGVGCLDLLFETFCKHLGMEKLKNLPNGSGERVFCWLGKRKASEILPTLRPNHHIVNRLPMDVFLKDKQSLAFTLQSSIFQRGIGYPEHD
uniref:NARG2_C domain-containing protein n=2 Tax=Macrostomum lignano TaxID=282301 RepID=A0A1I8G3T5_9PLAT